MSTSSLKTQSTPATSAFAKTALTKRASLNAVAIALDFAARLVVGLVLQPFLVIGLGDYLYGAWKVLGRMTGYVSAAGGRPTQALKWSIASHQASADVDEKRRRVATAIVVWLIFLPVLVSLGGVATWFAPALLRTTPEFAWTVRTAAALLISSMILSNLLMIPRTVLRGENLEYKRMGTSTILVFVGGGLTALALYLDTGLVGVSAAYLATMFLTAAFFLWIVRTHVPWFGVARPSWDAVRQFLGLSWWFLAWRLVIQLTMSSDIIVLGVLGTLELVTAYSLTKYAAEVLTNAILKIVGGVMPGLGGIIGSGNLAKGKRVRSEVMQLTWLIATVFGATILLWNQDFVRLWVGGQYAQSALSTLLIVVMVIQWMMIHTDAAIIDLTLKLSMKTILGAVSATTSLLLAGILVGYFDAGIPGLCLGFIAGRLILSIGYPSIVGRALQISLGKQLVRSIRPALTMGSLFAMLWMLDKHVHADNWLGLIAGCSLTSMAVFVVAVFAGLTRNQRDQLWGRVNKVIPVRTKRELNIS